MSNRKLYIAAYDIAEASRLRRALLVVRDFATGGQKSVHECFLTKNEKRELSTCMRELIDSKSDRFLLIPVEPRGKIHTLGSASAAGEPEKFLVA